MTRYILQARYEPVVAWTLSAPKRQQTDRWHRRSVRVRRLSLCTYPFSWWQRTRLNPRTLWQGCQLHHSRSILVSRQIEGQTGMNSDRHFLLQNYVDATFCSPWLRTAEVPTLNVSSPRQVRTAQERSLVYEYAYQERYWYSILVLIIISSITSTYELVARVAGCFDHLCCAVINPHVSTVCAENNNTRRGGMC